LSCSFIYVMIDFEINKYGIVVNVFEANDKALYNVNIILTLE